MAPNVNKGTKMATGGSSDIPNQGEQTVQFDQTQNGNAPPANELLTGQIDQIDQHPRYQDNQNTFNNQMHGTQISGMQGMQGMQPFYPAPPPYYNNANNVVHQDGGMQSSSHVNGNGNGHGTYDQSQMNNSPILTFMQQMQQQMQQTNNTVLTRLTAIEQSVSKLAPIEQNISALIMDVTNLKSENKHLSTKVCEVERSCQTISSIFDRFMESKCETDTDICDLKATNKQLSEKLDHTYETLNKVSEDLLDIKSRSMRENLLFFGLQETHDRTDPNSMPEDAEGLLRDFLKTEVLPDSQEMVDSIRFDRVHRLGRNYDKDKPRPIVAKFENYSDREKVRKASYEVNKERNGYSVREQFPFEIEQRRKVLYPIMHEYRKNKDNKVVLIKDKLFINDAQYIPSEQEIAQAEANKSAKRPLQTNARKRVQVQRSKPHSFQHENRFQMLGSSYAENFTPLRSDTRAKQKASSRSPLEDDANKRYKTNTSQNESESESSDHSNSVAMEIPQNPAQGESDQNEIIANGE